jgi:hypothetical protein
MAQCVFRHAPDDGPAAGRCPRQAFDGGDRCPFHLSPGERNEAGVDAVDLREAVLADVRSGEDRRTELAGARFDDLDLSSLVLDGEDRGRIVLRDVTVEGAASITGGTFGGEGGSGSCLTARRAAFEAGLDVTGTVFEGFPFAAYRDLLRDNGWRIHEYAGEADVDIEDLEITYLEAKQGAIGVGDNESAAAFFIQEMRYRRGRYAAHLRDHSYGVSHRIGAAVRWTTNAFLGFLSGYGERPGRVLLASLAVIVGAGLVYPAVGIETINGAVLAYEGAGPEAVLDGLYFSVVVFTTLGLGDVTPTGGIGRVIVGTEALVGAFLTALFVFTLGRSVAG